MQRRLPDVSGVASPAGDDLPIPPTAAPRQSGVAVVVPPSRLPYVIS